VQYVWLMICMLPTWSRDGIVCPHILCACSNGLLLQVSLCLKVFISTPPLISSSSRTTTHYTAEKFMMIMQPSKQNCFICHYLVQFYSSSHLWNNCLIFTVLRIFALILCVKNHLQYILISHDRLLQIKIFQL
jgi:hypothetical protein